MHYNCLDIVGHFKTWSFLRYFLPSYFFILSHFRTEYVDLGGPLSVRPDGCVDVWMCVCVCLSVTASQFHNSWPILIKLWSNNLKKNLRWHFSQIFEILIRWRHNSFFTCFTMRHSHVFNFCAIFFKLISFVFHLIALHGIANQHFRFISSIQNGGRKNGKTVKNKICENRKTKRWFTLIWHRWWRIWPNLGRPIHNWPLK